MLEVYDYSNRRGVIALMLTKIYAVMAENAEKDRQASLPPPGNRVLWTQRYKKIVVEINRRWLFVMDGNSIAGFLFYRLEENGSRIYLDEFMLAWPYRHNAPVFTMLLDKFMNDRAVRDASEVFAGERIRIEHDKEMLAAVGFKDEYADGYESLGAPDKAADALKLRYGRA